MNYDCIVIGGGASGLFAAINVKNKHNSVLIIEHTDRVGKKILSTGNGKCNLTNTFCKVDLFASNPEGLYPFYTSGSKAFIENVINGFDCDDAVTYFNDLGILLENKNGYIYPRSEQASSINDILRSACSSRGVDLVTGFSVSKIKQINEGEYRFSIDGRYRCKCIILAAGGMSAAKTGSDGSGYKLAEGLGHSIIRPIPALCGIRCSDKFFKELAGVRCDAALSLYDDKKNMIISSSGNLQFTAYGISGIPVFQISSVIGRLLDEKKKFSLRIDLLPEIPADELTAFLDRDYKDKLPAESSGSEDPYRSNKLLGVLNSKLGHVIEKEVLTSGKHPGETYGERVVPVIKRFKVTPVQLNSFEDAQTTCGGISTDEINPFTMESKLVPGLYFAGEIIDVNGICGGYNLQWAWSTGYIAAKDINNK